MNSYEFITTIKSNESRNKNDFLSKGSLMDFFVYLLPISKYMSYSKNVLVGSDHFKAKLAISGPPCLVTEIIFGTISTEVSRNLFSIHL